MADFDTRVLMDKRQPSLQSERVALHPLLTVNEQKSGGRAALPDLRLHLS